MTTAGRTIGVDRKVVIGGLITVASLLLAGSLTWVVSTTISHGNRLASVESSNEQIRDDLTYVRARVDELLTHLLRSP